MNDVYVRWEMSATRGNIRLFARSVTPEHKDRTLALWQKMRARDIVVTEIAGAPELPTWDIEVPKSKGYERFTLQASSEERVKQELRKRKYKVWQVMQTKIKQQ